jgi:hypothetical protein
MAAVQQNGGLTTELQPGDTLSMEFGSTPSAEGMIRDLFLVTRGVYTSALPAKQHPGEPTLPNRFGLEQNRPNPFRGSTTIRFALPTAVNVRLEIFDMQGRRVAELVNGAFAAGYKSIDWDHRDASGNLVRPGVYLYRLTAGSFRDQKKMVLLAQ